MPNAHLKASVEEAEQLVHYCQRNGKEIDPAIIREIAKARESLDQGTLAGDSEASFLTKYSELSKAVLPVTVGSIRDSIPEYGSQRKDLLGNVRMVSQAERPVRGYKIRGLVALLCLLAVQIYWVIGATLITDITNLKEAMEKSQSPAADEKILNSEVSVAVRYGILDSWYRFWIPEKEPLPPVAERVAADGEEAWTKKPPGAPDVNVKLHVESKHRLDIIQIYVLPLLYGFVGAVAYVLRQLIIEIRTRTFRLESLPAYQLRLFLGTLSGLAIGWFFNSDSVTVGVASLTPIALSFLAGYSVEVLFTAMDNVVQAFGSSAQKSPG